MIWGIYVQQPLILAQAVTFVFFFSMFGFLGWVSRSLSSALLSPLLREGSHTKIDYRKRSWYPSSNLKLQEALGFISPTQR